MIARWLVLVWLALLPLRARAQIDVDTTLDGRRLDAEVGYLLDPTGTATFAQVRARRAAFRATDGKALHFGLSRGGACWLRIPVRNPTDRPQPWMLEVGYPHLDHVTLHLPIATGVETRDEGDSKPFDARAYRHHNFVFRIDEPARSERELYVRVATHGTLYMPLRAWDERNFTEHHHLAFTILFGFYGIVLIMAAYNLLLFALSRLPEYGLFAFVVLSEGFEMLVTSGHGFQFLYPDQVALAQRMVPFSMNLAIFANCLFAAHHVFEVLPRWVHRTLKWLTPITAVCTLLVLVAPQSGVVLLVGFCYVVLIPFAAMVALRWHVSHRSRDTLMSIWTNAVATGWLAAQIGLTITALTVMGILPPNTWTIWSGAVGASVQCVLIAAALASRVRWLQRDVAAVNEALQHKVEDLGAAIDLAQTETARAEAAAHERSEIIATMSHELRTPLNAIINIPEGLEERFEEVDGARCGVCASVFSLEQGETLAPDAPCPSCDAPGMLAPTKVGEHIGDPAQSVRYLELVEKAGRHLLQVIHGILDASPENRGLHTTTQDVVVLLEEVVEQMSAVAARASVRLRVVLAHPSLVLSVDALRFRQILINLIGNAIKFSNPGGEVTVSASVDGALALFSVADRGIGIPEEKHASVFESFEQAHDPAQRRYGGTGLGLSIVRSLVRLHGGKVWLESEVGKGTTFFVSLPLRREAAA
ncbi:MAG: 7TM-DISM domain-containing protein [Polyangiales bacterium]